MRHLLRTLARHIDGLIGFAIIMAMAWGVLWLAEVIGHDYSG